MYNHKVVSGIEWELEDLLKDLPCFVYRRDPNKGGKSCTMRNSSAVCTGNRCQIHDHYLQSFMQDIEAGYVFQIHTTSPLLEASYIKDFVSNLIQSDRYTSLFAVSAEQLETFYKDKPLNFNIERKQPTQTLDPISVICWAICGWRRDVFMEGYEKGPTFYGSTGFKEIPKMQALDVDNPDDLFMVEACLAHKKKTDNIAKWMYNHKVVSGIEWELEDLIDKDGSPLTGGFANKRKTSLKEVREECGDGEWCHPLVFTDLDQVCFIQQHKAKGCRKHFHPTKSEWWYIVDGTFRYDIWDYKNQGDITEEPSEVVIAHTGDVVYLEKGKIHVITCETDRGVRLACGGRDMSHVYIK
jgi:CMP-N-acetylneuraminic acid synthetase